MIGMCKECENRHIEGICENCFEDNLFKPKDKPMKDKVIFESEEEFSLYDNQVNDSTYKSRLKKAKERGFIRKSPVEEAEELFQNKHQHDQAWVMSKMNDAIQYLKAENERLKK